MISESLPVGSLVMVTYRRPGRQAIRRYGPATIERITDDRYEALPVVVRYCGVTTRVSWDSLTPYSAP